jgi:hypothetical protein
MRRLNSPAAAAYADRAVGERLSRKLAANAGSTANSGTEVSQREFRRRLATALRAVLNVAPTTQKACPLGVKEHDKGL